MDWEKRGKWTKDSAKCHGEMESSAEAATCKGRIGQKSRKRKECEKCSQESMKEKNGRQCVTDRKVSRRRHRRMLYISILICIVLLHIAARSSRRFCDWYLEHAFRIWVNTYGRLMGMAPFSVGEILIGLEAGFGAIGAVLGAIWLIGKAAAWCKGRRSRSGIPDENREKDRTQIRASGEGAERERRRIGASGEGAEKERRRIRASGEDVEREQKWHSSLGRVCKAYCRAGLWMLLGAFALMTLNCYILYHGSGFSGKYLIGEEKDYSLEELAMLRNFLVEQCNTLCCQVLRKEDGSIAYEGDMLETAKAAMGHLGETYEGLSGFYPTPKPLCCSDFMCQQHIAGCYFPFSMEANYNDVMYVLNLPSTLCHELGHLKGYILEDEANLIGYLACVQSEDIIFRYSGYLSVLYYVDNDFRQALESSGGSAQMLITQQDRTLNESKLPGQPENFAQTEILPQVHADNIFLMAEERARIEQEAFLDMETVDAVSDSIADASLKLKGVPDGMVSYSRVVELLLRYYDIYGYP